jgi:ribose 5-phosphate isomerase B
MRIAVGSDHAGYELKSRVARQLVEAGHEVLDLGTDSAQVPVDYPVYGRAVAECVVAGEADYGVCVCGTGIGISIAANKVIGARAALAYDVTTASLARRHNDANVLCLGGRTTGAAQAADVVTTFLVTAFEGGRHQRRIDAIARDEAARHPGPPVAVSGRRRHEPGGEHGLGGGREAPRGDQGDHEERQASAR